MASTGTPELGPSDVEGSGPHVTGVVRLLKSRFRFRQEPGVRLCRFVRCWARLLRSGRPNARRGLPGRTGEGRVSVPGIMRAGNATALAVIDRLFDDQTPDDPTMALTTSIPVGKFVHRGLQIKSEYTLFPPSDCPTNQDHLNRPLTKGRPQNPDPLRKARPPPHCPTRVLRAHLYFAVGSQEVLVSLLR